MPIAAALVAILAVHAVLALVLSRSLTETLLEREGKVAQEFLTSILSAEGTADKLFDTPAPSPALESFAAHVQNFPGTIRANIYSPDGYIRHSTEPAFIGLQFGDNAELSESFRGKLISKLEEISASAKDEHLALNRMAGEKVAEAYIPVAAPDGRVVAVVEFYRKAEIVEDTVRAMTNKVWLAAGISGLILFVAIVLVMSLAPRRRDG